MTAEYADAWTTIAFTREPDVGHPIYAAWTKPDGTKIRCRILGWLTQARKAADRVRIEKRVIAAVLESDGTVSPVDRVRQRDWTFLGFENAPQAMGDTVSSPEGTAP
jgi:hypothetical protein